MQGGEVAGIRIRHLTLLRGADSFALTGHTLADAFRFAGVPFVRPDGLPSHRVADGAPFTPDPAALETLDALYANAARELERVRASQAGAGPVRLWPHHFDIATLISRRGDGSGEPERQVGCGFVAGDAQIPEPYWYVTPWPYPPADALPALSMGRWNTKGWTGAVLREGEGDGGRFLDEALALLLGLRLA